MPPSAASASTHRAGSLQVYKWSTEPLFPRNQRLCWLVFIASKMVGFVKQPRPTKRHYLLAFTFGAIRTGPHTDDSGSTSEWSECGTQQQQHKYHLLIFRSKSTVRSVSGSERRERERESNIYSIQAGTGRTTSAQLAGPFFSVTRSHKYSQPLSSACMHCAVYSRARAPDPEREKRHV